MGRMANCECGGFTLAYLVTGSSGVCRAHFTLSLVVDSATLRNVQTRVNQKKEGAAPKQGQRHDNARNRTQMQGKAQNTLELHRVNKRVRSFCG
jgi:hypothetical protein